ncbi:MAG: hypothetical protein ACE5FW_01480 [Candidatus Aenigmatarchaeota archaeon]
MPLMYKCPVCGFEAYKKGKCGKCKAELEEVCSVCGEALSKCTGH